MEFIINEQNHTWWRFSILEIGSSLLAFEYYVSRKGKMRKKSVIEVYKMSDYKKNIFQVEKIVLECKMSQWHIIEKRTSGHIPTLTAESLYMQPLFTK